MKKKATVKHMLKDSGVVVRVVPERKWESEHRQTFIGEAPDIIL